MNADRSRFEDDLFREILKSERLRARALMLIMGVLFVNGLMLDFLPLSWNPIRRLLGDRFPVRTMALFWGAGFLYELVVQAVVGRAIAGRFHPPAGVRYGNALIETSFPTIMLLFVSDAAGPEIALNSPIPMVYFLFISLSTLRLGAPLSVFTGCVAALEFASLGFWLLPSSDPGPETFFSSAVPVAMKAVVMIVAGAVCGFVGAQIRERLIASLQSLSEKNRVVGMFGQYVSPAVVDQLLTQPLGDKGEIRYVTIMFLDIRDFTTFAERRRPEEVIDYLNTLFGTMITLINANHGIINKFLGDGFLACFGAPLSDGRDTQNAVKAAVEIAGAIDRMAAAGTIPPTRIGIGLHAGQAMTGIVGSEERKEYTIIGDTVNLASRVEQLTKRYGSVLLVTDAVWQVVKADYPGRQLEPVIVKGRQEPVAIYALL